LPGLVVHHQLEAILKERLLQQTPLLGPRVAFRFGLYVETF